MATHLTTVYEQDAIYLRIAREIAINLYDTETVLKNNGIDSDRFERIRNDPRFIRLLEAELTAWNAPGNIQERTKLKAGALIEEFLPEANARIHDPKETLTAKNELIKTLTRIAGMGLERAGSAEGGGSGFTVTINLGSDQKLEFRNAVTPQVIEGEVLKEV